MLNKYFIRIIFTLLITNICFSQSDTPITLRAQFNGSYGYTIIGNTHNAVDNWFQNPPPPCLMLTQSAANLNLQSNQTIVAAYLYWGGIGDGTLNPIIKFNNIPYVATQIFTCFPEPTPTIVYFNAFTDVTNQVQNTGNGVYNFTDIDLNSIINNYCSSATYNLGWHLIVIYSDLSLPSTQLNVYDGNNVAFGAFNNGVTNIPINNLNVIDNQSAQLTYVALNGSPNLYYNEAIEFNGIVLSNALNPPNNPFNGTNSFTGSTTNWNQDIDTFDISPYVNIGDTQANITLKSGFARFIQTVVTSFRSELPDATVPNVVVTVQQTCNNRNLTIDYTVANVNSNLDLSANVTVSFYVKQCFVANGQHTNECCCRSKSKFANNGNKSV